MHKTELAIVGTLVWGGSLAVASGADLASAVAGSPGRHLSIEQGVEALRAIERVSWSHRIWPKESPGKKPALEEVSHDPWTCNSFRLAGTSDPRAPRTRPRIRRLVGKRIEPSRGLRP